MAMIYFRSTQGKKISIEVSDEIAKQYRECLIKEWRTDSYEKYYSKSLEGIIESGRDFVDVRADTEKIVELKESQNEQAALIEKLKVACSFLTDLQRQTIHKLFDLNMTQAEIAKEEGVAHQVVSKRVARIYSQLKKFLEKN